MVQELEQEIYTLKNENDVLKTQNEKLNEKDESRNLEVVQLKEQFDNFKTDLIFKTNQIEILEQKLTQYKVENEELMSELTREKQEFKHLLYQNDCLRQDRQ